ncbi:MAG: flagellin FliC [Myxococcales bacterium]|nr:flagellin FliC [Myxococcales bacterium]MCB9652015.1 flagellin FliC [Deltaproteobacteria bacterium]
MALVINTNVASLGAQRTLNRTTQALQRNIEKLSSGYRVNRAADDAAGLGISENLRASIRSLAQASRNANDGISMLQVAEAAMNEQAGILTRLRELAVQSSNGVLGTTERSYIDTEAQALVAEVDRIAAVTEFNGVFMIAPGATPIDMQVGLNQGDVITVNFSASDTGTLGAGLGGAALSTLDLGTSQASAQSGLSIIDQAITDLSTARSTLGATQNRLEVTISNLDSARENLAAANSRIRDVDVAEETASMTRNQILSQAGTAVLAQANQIPQAALSLLGN